MNKKIIAAAIAASFAAPAVMAASDNVTIYGHVRQSVDMVDNNNGATDEWVIADKNTRMGFKGSEDLGNGLKALFQLEYNVRASQSTNGGQVGGNTAIVANRNTFVGLAGDFGTVLIGRHDAPHQMSWKSNNPFGDTVADLKSGAYSPITWERVDGTIAYVSPSFSGLTGAIAIVPLEITNAQDGLADVVSAALMYNNGGLFLGAGIMDAPGSFNMDEWNVTATYKMDAFKVGVTYEDMELAANNDQETWAVTGTYTMGNNVIKAHYFDSDEDVANADSDGFAIGLQHKFSKRTNAEVVYADVDAEAGSSEADGDTFSVQLNHAF